MEPLGKPRRWTEQGFRASPVLEPGPDERPDRRKFLQTAGLVGSGWLTVVSRLLAVQAERTREPAQSVILLWLAGGPSQLETFDPHPGASIAGGTTAIATNVKGIRLAADFEHLAEVMDSVSLVRSMVSKEGDHERGTYLMKTGYRPDPTVAHPSIGAICCHELPTGKTEIPRHISILPGQWPSRGGFLGDEYDAFKVGDPAQKLPDLTGPVPQDRDSRRVSDLDVVERAFARGRESRVETTLHRTTLHRARVMMTSEQLAAFDVALEPAQSRQTYGDTPFGRACLAARRLIEVGVRCVEVTLDGWDTHANNHALQRERASPTSAVARIDSAKTPCFSQIRLKSWHYILARPRGNRRRCGSFRPKWSSRIRCAFSGRTTQRNRIVRPSVVGAMTSVL